MSPEASPSLPANRYAPLRPQSTKFPLRPAYRGTPPHTFRKLSPTGAVRRIRLRANTGSRAYRRRRDIPRPVVPHVRPAGLSVQVLLRQKVPQPHNAAASSPAPSTTRDTRVRPAPRNTHRPIQSARSWRSRCARPRMPSYGKRCKVSCFPRFFIIPLPHSRSAPFGPTAASVNPSAPIHTAGFPALSARRTPAYACRDGNRYAR